MNLHDPIFVAPPITELPDYLWSPRYGGLSYLPRKPVRKPEEEGRRNLFLFFLTHIRPACGEALNQLHSNPRRSHVGGRVGTPGGLSTPGQGQGEGPVGYKFRRKRERSRQWEGPEWSEAERSPPGVPTLPITVVKAKLRGGTIRGRHRRPLVPHLMAAKTEEIEQGALRLRSSLTYFRRL